MFPLWWAERKWFLHKAGLPDYWCNGDFSPIEGNSSAAFTPCATPKSSDATSAGLTKFRRKETTAQITVPPQGLALTAVTRAEMPKASGSNRHKIVQLRRCDALIDKTELACVPHFACSIQQTGHGRAVK